METSITYNLQEGINPFPDDPGHVHEERVPRFDSDYQLGLGCFLVSSVVFCVSEYKIGLSPLQDGLFIIPYAVALFYLSWLLGMGKVRMFWQSQPREFLHHRLLLGNIWLVSCFSLNQAFPIFKPSAPWLIISIIAAAFVSIVYTWEKRLPPLLRGAQFFLMGVSAILWTYFALYLTPVYPVGVLGLLALGLGCHSFVPLLIVLTHVRVLRIHIHTFKAVIFAGLIVPILFMACFVLRWYWISSGIRHKIDEIAMRPTEDLPDWVVLAGQLDDNTITRKVMMGEQAYQMASKNWQLLSEGANSRNLVQHDPLVMIASIFNDKIDMAEADRAKILNVLYDTRHDTQERLWSGSNLRTAHVTTQARVYPDLRLAYTEKTISIANHAGSPFWREEALYTFHLPEGSVVSSLSLWINGVEEKAYLTSQAKADSAYKTIVGVESRDPSVVHWQEGNTVKVKVFPCTSKENRRFRIGVTTPLLLDGNRLVYENIWFKGPGAFHANEMIKIEFPQGSKQPDLPFNATHSTTESVTYEGDYRSSWQAKFEATPLAKSHFTFQGKTYSIEPAKTTTESFIPGAYYLDINQSWSKAEFDELWPLLKQRPAHAAGERLIQLSDSNKDEVFETLKAARFSLFPIHLINAPEHAMLITKTSGISPTLHDLARTPFAKALGRSGGNVRTFIVGSEISPYIKSLKELRIIHGKTTDWEALKDMLAKGRFPADPETDSTVVHVYPAGILIREKSGVAPGNAPDHLFRLFAYNHMLRELGMHYLDGSYQTDSLLNARLIAESQAAHIVTPVSSMVVLESRKDYDRFDIRKSKNSLDNATLKLSGAVPEPHEWALIILFAIVVAYITFRRYVH